MLENTPFWTPGGMHLWIDNKPTHVYVPEASVKSTYETLQSRLSKEGSIPIGIDHLPDNIVKANPVLAKLDLLNVGNITQIEYTDDAIRIAEAELTNPQIRQLYLDGELDMVSIVANSTTSECPRGDYDYIINTTDITRVDIVEKGACTACNIPKPTDSSDTVVYARYAIQKEEENDMSDFTIEDIKKIFDESIDEKLAPMQEQINTLLAREPADPTGDEGESIEDDEKVKEMEARIADLKKESATAKVDNLIAQGKIVPAKKDTMVELCASNSELFEELMEDAPVLIDLKTRKSLLAGNSDDDDDEPEPTPEEENVNAVLAHFSGDE